MTARLGLAERLLPTLERAREVATQRGAAVLASAACELADFDALGVFARANGADRALWQQPDRDFALVGIGTAVQIDAAGPQRFQQAAATWRACLDGAVIDRPDDAPLTLPVAVGGFAFRPGASPLPDGSLVLPRLLFLRDGGRAWLNICSLVTPDTDVATRVEASAEEVSMLAGGAVQIDCGAPHLRTQASRARADWDRGVATILEAIERGEVEKAVLTRRLGLDATDAIDPVPALARLGERYPHCTVFAFATGQRCFLGATPERLVRVEGAGVTVDCLAGSIARGHDAAEDEALAARLLADPKERREHAIVARALREALEPVCERVDAPEEPGIYRAANVQHLHTPFAATAKPGHDVFDLVARLHPTPAMGGYPRAAALDLLARCESFDRGWYTGPIGWADAAGNGEFAVAIRSALLEGARATLYAGAGIVAGSDAGREWEETALKLQTMLWALQAS